MFTRKLLVFYDFSSCNMQIELTNDIPKMLTCKGKSYYQSNVIWWIIPLHKCLKDLQTVESIQRRLLRILIISSAYMNATSGVPKGENGGGGLDPHSSKIWPPRFIQKRYYSFQEGCFPSFARIFRECTPNHTHFSPYQSWISL